ncbi:hypothetical protein DB347_14005 [Opitutaceae bacterium EW11]|nr:hypothetical protein DB347_14005 [Opitutaceae bacterium EW11]
MQTNLAAEGKSAKVRGSRRNSIMAPGPQPSAKAPAFVANGRLRLEYALATARRLEEARIRREVVAQFAEEYRKAGYFRRYLLDLKLERAVADAVARMKSAPRPSAAALFLAENVQSVHPYPAAEDVRQK